jgi:hypothetical protein
MNNKLLKATIAGAATLAIAASTQTFALWSDHDTLTGSQAGAEELSLTLGEPNTQNFNNMKLAPGVGSDFEFVVTSRTGTTIPTAALSMQLTNLVGKEDGCTSTNSEKDVDADCNDTATEGEFLDQARIIVNVSQPTTDVANACDSGTHARGNIQSAISLRDLRNATLGTPLDLLDGDTLAPGEGICVAMGLNMPTSANNASQGDSASFDLKFLLDQVV